MTVFQPLLDKATRWPCHVHHSSPKSSQNDLKPLFINGYDHPNLIVSTHHPDACAGGVFRFDDRGRGNSLTESRINSLSAVPIPCTDSVVQPYESTLPKIDGENDQNTDDFERLRERSGKLFGKPSGKASKPAARSKSLGRRSHRAGLIVRGTTYYVRLSVPKSLHGIVGRKEFVRSLRTGRCLEAARKARIVAADFERWLTGHIEGSVAAPPPTVATEMTAAPSPPSFAAKPSGKTLREVCEVFLTDPTKNRSAKAASSYWNAVEIAEAAHGLNKVISDYGRQSARDIVAMLKWIPSNAKKRFPKLDYRQAAEKGRTGRYPLLSAKSVNDYIIKLSTLLNFAINEGWVDRNPFRGLQLNDDVHPRDKRHPFSSEQLNRIFNAPLYRGCRDDEAGYATLGNAQPRRGRFWIPLIALYSGMRLNEICQLDLKDVVEIEDNHLNADDFERLRKRREKLF
jgi:hypothetical protein